MVEAGVDIVEIGVPYSDPLMDGPIIQHAAEAALAARRRGCATCSAPCGRSPTPGAPALVMTYWNPVERYGVDRFAADLAAAGGAGVITPDLIPDEARRVDGGRRARTTSTGSSSSRPAPPTPGCATHRRGLPRLRLRRLDDGRHRRPRPASATPPAPWWPGPAR